MCDNIFKKNISDECECDYMKTYSSQGFSGATINSIKCLKEQNILKVNPLSEYYIKLRKETNKYIFIEMDGFTIQTIINTYVYREVPNNTINIINSGACKSVNKKLFNKNSNYYGYNLMEEANLGDGYKFFLKLLVGNFDDEFNITNEDKRYLVITNFLLQCILIIGHLQCSSLEFFHGDYKPENVFIKRSNKNTITHFTFKVFGKIIKVKNMGFAVLIADFDRSSITIKDDLIEKKYRLIPPILFKPFLTSNVNNIINNYGDIDPDNILESSGNKDYLKNGVKIEKMFISKLVPRKMDPTITILRSAGIKLFRDFDLYTFFIRLIETKNIRKYFIDKRFTETIMSFMSKTFIKELLNTPVKVLSQNESALVAVEIFNKIKEPMNSIFSDNYIDRLKSLNYKLFK